MTAEYPSASATTAETILNITTLTVGNGTALVQQSTVYHTVTSRSNTTRTSQQSAVTSVNLPQSSPSTLGESTALATQRFSSSTTLQPVETAIMEMIGNTNGTPSTLTAVYPSSSDTTTEAILSTLLPSTVQHVMTTGQQYTISYTVTSFGNNTTQRSQQSTVTPDQASLYLSLHISTLLNKLEREQQIIYQGTHFESVTEEKKKTTKLLRKLTNNELQPSFDQ
ncbi:uncharacterized protein LOC134909539 [Pseudophryne corroboree]|uniref:uncharacterized protein LOC134909539 n=1 Tax=Pseudophryne corroboree TaxID=495146 RepID=UPI00308182EB